MEYLTAYEKSLVDFSKFLDRIPCEIIPSHVLRENYEKLKDTVETLIF